MKNKTKTISEKSYSSMRWLMIIATLVGMNINVYGGELIKNVSGDHAVIREADPLLQKHTIYRPQHMASGKKYPLVAFANGGCISIGNLFEPLLSEIASHGYIVVSGGDVDPELNIAKLFAPPVEGENKPPAFTQDKTEQLLQTLDWAEKVNGIPGNTFSNKIDTQKMAVAGQSCGGLQSIVAGADPRVKTVLVLNSGIIRAGILRADGRVDAPAFLPGTVEDLKNLHTPTLYIVGGETDQAYVNAERDFDDIKNIPLFYGNLDVGHSGTWMLPHGGEMGGVVLQWLNWQLKNNNTSSAYFSGTQCTLCENSDWVIKKKNL